MTNKNMPEIRFPGFTEEWEQRKFNNLVVRVNKITNSNSLPKIEFEDILAGEGRLNKDVSQKFDNRKGVEFLPNDILYGKLRPYLKNWLKPSFTGVALGDFWVFRVIKSDSDFIYSLIQSDKYQRVANDTSGTKMPRSDWKKVAETEFLVPDNRNEQQKIGNFFKQLDDTIALHQRELELLKETKKGFLQKMFPKEGEKVPEIRFPGFTEEWEQRKLGEVVRITMGQSPNSANYTKNPQDYILVQGNADMKNSRVVPRVWTTQVTKQAEKGDLILSVRAPVGDIGKTDYDVVIGRGVAAIKGNDFIFHQLGKMKEDGFWSRFSTGSTFESINSNDIREALITTPSEEEQQKIGTFFKQLDDTIALHQRELDLLKETKKGFLQKLFV
ncbi:restriction endonuclease subunit S [Enterococcus gallinarum]|uniref:Type I restriction modification DNA specificity domain-containing protein n=1 Tax=Enterococcus gallinarum TaxID=1353 RepID=A0A376H6C7_ENTGA|nr:restriction endonuclease subunit S [Enterococcus gallinarum]STD84724.1 Type I restriction modification DNA specificity domain-containing protein [Enterococcus gallinarum]STD86649.1 Type I restriction modification DNA specificity domain-containing protein [Enterococcus gallinarum]